MEGHRRHPILPPALEETHHPVPLGSRPGWLDYSAALREGPADFVADPSITARDMMLIYFTSGTSGMPKMVCHDYAYPLGHIVTACYWQQVQDNGLHLTGVDSGWA